MGDDDSGEMPMGHDEMPGDSISGPGIGTDSGQSLVMTYLNGLGCPLTGGAAAPLLAASRTRAGRKTFGRFLNDDGTDPMMAGDEMPVSTQIAGMGDIGSWWTRNREKVMGFGAGAASAALVASGASKGTGLNTLLTQGWDAAKGFLVPQSPGGGPAPAPVLMQMAQASIGGMDSAPGRPARSRGCKSPTLKT